MNSTKILFAVALIAFSCVTFSYAIKCYSCDSTSTCKSPKKVECTYSLANNTRAYLDFHHTGVNQNTTSPYMECFSEAIKSNFGDYRYKGCNYNNINACQLPLRDVHNSGSTTRTCNRCDNKDLCNPAGRASISTFALIGTIVIGFLGRYVCA